ncbi:protease pro-enzyme activation domain-containing protein [uncultured Jatrophihabitans sp.]|uniref:S53 family peptidase n=1 Tax=uncultured Jatrophihabitans sp. TaxID=1610747 RepID=UPI0035C952ED
MAAATTVTLLGAAAAVAALPHAAGAATGTQWAPTATNALSLKDATSQGTAAASTPLHLTVGLTPRDSAGLDQLIQAQATPSSSSYHQYLSKAQFTDRFAATQATASAVSSYLSSQGLTNVKVASNRLQITAESTVANAEKAFNTKISRYTQNGRTVLANTASAQVPAALSSAVSGVLGLSTLGVHAAPAPTVPKLTGYYPKEFNTVYDSGSTSSGSGSTLAVIAEGDLTQTVKDLRTAEANQNLPQTPVNLIYAGAKTSDTSGTDEWDLDTQTSTGIASGVDKLDIYIAPSLSDADLAAALNKFASDNDAQAGSASLGECDILPYLDGAAKVDDAALAEAASQGQTFFASSGDTGSSCAVLPTNGVPGSGPTDTEYPASSPYTTGVGGTTLDTDASDTYATEIAWNAGGGGISPVAKAPAFQKGVSPAAKLGLRGVPDVAFDADPTTGGNIYVDGASETIGGTSLASPLALGLWTRINATHGNKLGAAAPKLYKYYSGVQGGSITKTVPGFHDITLGANGLYTALPGYDYTTGLGSWDVAKLSAALS